MRTLLAALLLLAPACSRDGLPRTFTCAEALDRLPDCRGSNAARAACVAELRSELTAPSRDAWDAWRSCWRYLDAPVGVYCEAERAACVASE